MGYREAQPQGRCPSGTSATLTISLHAALTPLVDGYGLIAVRVSYGATTDGIMHNVGVIGRGGSAAVREKLSEEIREAVGEDDVPAAVLSGDGERGELEVV